MTADRTVSYSHIAEVEEVKSNVAMRLSVRGSVGVRAPLVRSVLVSLP